jgi:four helix bundle protein
MIRDGDGTYTVRRFEDLVAWQRARELAAEIYRVTNDGQFARDFALRGQIRRAAVSVLSNIAEGYERASYAEFHHFLAIAKGSCAELRAQLYVAGDIGCLASTSFDQLLARSEELGRIIGGLRISVQKRLDKK